MPTINFRPEGVDHLGAIQAIFLIMVNFSFLNNFTLIKLFQLLENVSKIVKVTFLIKFETASIKMEVFGEFHTLKNCPKINMIMAFVLRAKNNLRLNQAYLIKASKLSQLGF